MKRVFAALFLLVVSAFCLNCLPAADSNQPVSNTNMPAAAPQIQANTNVAPVDEPVPVFTAAPEAFDAGNKYFDADEIEKSVAAFRQAVKLDPDLAEAHFKLGIAYDLLENESEEETPAETPSKKKKKGAKETTKLKPSEKSFAEAARAYEKIVKKNEKEDAAFFNLGRSYNKLNEDEKAEKALRQAAKLKPDDAEYQTEHGKILIKLADYDEAVTALKKAVSLDETDSQAAALLEKAEAGKKRTNFGIKPKPPEEALTNVKGGKPRLKGSPKPPTSSREPMPPVN